eukprot:TRINITY_DN49_c0_g1_i1.p1 TRINITY_DN49_c0_g1~~TRINITY_DN49_c0_g1_i1.p1  ORF type:complete len:342 (-),score=56.21 TRINITY_DN49_c0_g1_i1:513-1403(-)
MAVSMLKLSQPACASATLSVSDKAVKATNKVCVPGFSFAEANNLALSVSPCSSRSNSIFEICKRANRSVVYALASGVEPSLDEESSASQLDQKRNWAPAPGTKLYVGNLPFNVDSESLAEVFQDAGIVDMVEVMYDRETGRSRGFAFVTMNTEEGAQAAVEKFDGSELGGRSIKVNFPSEKPRSTSTRGPRTGGFRERSSGGLSRGGGQSLANRLYVGNLSWGMDDSGLEDLFSEFGNVVESKVVIDRETGRSRGFGFVTLSKPTEVAEAINALDGVEVDGRTIRVSQANERAPRA